MHVIYRRLARFCPGEVSEWQTECQKRPTTWPKETHYRGKRDLSDADLIEVKRVSRASREAKETYYTANRDPL